MQKRKIIKIAAYILFGLTLGIFLFIYFCGVGHFWLRDVIMQQAGIALNREIIVGKVSGNLITGITLSDVSLARKKKLSDGAMFSAHEVSISYSLWSLLWEKGNVLPALTKITLRDPKIYVERDSAGVWNFMKLVPPASPEAEAQPFALRAAISVENGTIIYHDAGGFGQLARPIDLVADNFNGGVKFHKWPVLNYSVNTVIHSVGETMRLAASGTLDTAKLNFAVKAKGQAVDLGILGRLVAFPDYEVKAGKANFDVTVTSSPKGTYLPVKLLGKFNLQNGAARIGPVEVRDFNAALEGKKERLAIKELSAQVSGNFISLSGDIAAGGENKLALHADVPDLKLETLSAIVPASNSFTLAGKGRASVDISGSLRSPKAAGTVDLFDGRLLKGYFNKFSAQVNFADNMLNVSVKGTEFFSGTVTGTAALNFKLKVPQIKARLDFSHINLRALGYPQVAGFADAALTADGNLEDVALKLKADLDNGEIMGQYTETVAVEATYTRGSFFIPKAELASPRSFLGFSGRWEKDGTFAGKIAVKDFVIQDRRLWKGVAARVERFKGEVAGRWGKELAEDPWNKLTLKLDGVVTEGEIAGQSINEIVLDGALAKGVLDLRQLKFSTPTAELVAAGRLGVGVASAINVQASGLALDTFPMLVELLPLELRTMGGDLDLSFEARGDIPARKKFDLMNLEKYMQAEVAAVLRGARLGERPLERIELAAAWDKERLKGRSLKMISATTNISVEGEVTATGGLDLTVFGILDLADVASFTHRYGRVNGIIAASMLVRGNVLNPDIIADLDARTLSYEQVKIDQLKGEIAFANGKLDLFTPLQIYKGRDLYEVSGGIVFPFDAAVVDYGRPDFNLKLALTRANLKTIDQLVFSGIDSLSEQKAAAPVARSGVVTAADLMVGGDVGDEPLYIFNDNNRIRQWDREYQAVAAERAARQKQVVDHAVSGEVTGFITIKGELAALSAQASIGVRHASYMGCPFDSLELAGSLARDRIYIDKCLLRRGEGYLQTGTGFIGLNGPMSLRMEAVSLPIDFLSAIVPLGKKFSGNMSLDLTLQGSLSDPKLAAVLEIDKGKIGEGLDGMAFDQVSGVFQYQNGWLNVSQLDVASRGQSGRVRGKVPIQAKGHMNIATDLSGENIGLLLSFSPAFQWVSGGGKAKLTISGPLTDPQFTGLLELKEAVIDIPGMGARIERLNTYVNVKKNVVKLYNLQGFWTGQSAAGKRNRIKMIGVLDFSQVFTASREVTFDLTLDDTLLAINMPNIFTGAIELSKVSLKGPLSLAEKANRYPSLTGEVKISDAVAYLPKGGGGGDKSSESASLMPVGLNVHVNVTKGTELKAAEGSITDIQAAQMVYNFDLVLNESDVDISGTLAEPNILGKVMLTAGKVEVLKREFSLLSTKEQGEYYKTDVYNIADNAAVFEGGKGMRGIMPRLDITAMIEIKDILGASTGGVVNKGEAPKELIVISKIAGQPFTEDPSRTLAVRFSVFDKETKKALDVSNSDVQVLLLPEFLQATLGLDKTAADRPPADTMDMAKGMAKDYFNASLKSFLSTGVSKKVQQALGFEDFSVNYNFGKDLDKLLPTGDGGDSGGKEPLWKVALTKRVFDRLYVSGEYQVGSGQAQTSANKTNYKYTIKYENVIPRVHLQYAQNTIVENEIPKSINDYSVMWDAVKVAGSELQAVYTFEPANYTYATQNHQLTLGAQWLF